MQNKWDRTKHNRFFLRRFLGIEFLRRPPDPPPHEQCETGKLAFPCIREPLHPVLFYQARLQIGSVVSALKAVDHRSAHQRHASDVLAHMRTRINFAHRQWKMKFHLDRRSPIFLLMYK